MAASSSGMSSTGTNPAAVVSTSTSTSATVATATSASIVTALFTPPPTSQPTLASPWHPPSPLAQPAKYRVKPKPKPVSELSIRGSSSGLSVRTGSSAHGDGVVSAGLSSGGSSSSSSHTHTPAVLGRAVRARRAGSRPMSVSLDRAGMMAGLQVQDDVGKEGERARAREMEMERPRNPSPPASVSLSLPASASMPQLGSVRALPGVIRASASARRSTRRVQDVFGASPSFLSDVALREVMQGEGVSGVSGEAMEASGVDEFGVWVDESEGAQSRDRERHRRREGGDEDGEEDEEDEAADELMSLEGALALPIPVLLARGGDRTRDRFSSSQCVGLGMGLGPGGFSAPTAVSTDGDENGDGETAGSRTGLWHADSVGSGVMARRRRRKLQKRRPGSSVSMGVGAGRGWSWGGESGYASVVEAREEAGWGLDLDGRVVGVGAGASAAAAPATMSRVEGLGRENTTARRMAVVEGAGKRADATFRWSTVSLELELQMRSAKAKARMGSGAVGKLTRRLKEIGSVGGPCAVGFDGGTGGGAGAGAGAGAGEGEGSPGLGLGAGVWTAGRGIGYTVRKPGAGRDEKRAAGRWWVEGDEGVPGCYGSFWRRAGTGVGKREVAGTTTGWVGDSSVGSGSASSGDGGW